MNAWWQCMTRTPMTTCSQLSMVAWWHCTMRTHGDNMTTFTDFHIVRGVSAHCPVLSCLYIVTLTRTVAQVMSLSHHPQCSCSCERFSFALFSPSTSRTSCPALLPLLPALEVRRLQPAVHSIQRGYGLVWRVPLLHRSWAQRLRFQGDLHGAPGLAAALLRQSLFCGRRLRWRCTRWYASSSTSSASQSLFTRRLVCQSVVVVNVR